jgi:hypothetical protein
VSSETARLKTEIRARKFHLMELTNEIDRKIRDIKDLLSGHPLTKIKDLRLRSVAEIAEEVANLQDKYLALLEEIKIGERELGDGE